MLRDIERSNFLFQVLELDLPEMGTQEADSFLKPLFPALFQNIPEILNALIEGSRIELPGTVDL